MPKKQLTPEDPGFLPAKYDLTAARMKKLAAEYDPKLIPEAREKGDEGYQTIHEKVMAITKVRTNIERVRKELVKDALDWQRKVNGEAKRLTGEVEALEAPWRDIKTDLDEREAREAEERRKAEEKRQAEIEGNIAAIKRLTEGLLGVDSSVIAERIQTAGNIDINEEQFGEYVEAATIMRDTVLATLQSAYDERKAFEDQQAEQARRQAELDAQAAEQAEAQRKLDEQKAAQEAAEKAERERKEREAREAAEKAEREEREKREAAELEARLPEDQKLRRYATDLKAVKAPKVKLEHSERVLVQALDRRDNLIKFILDNTQEKADVAAVKKTG